MARTKTGRADDLEAQNATLRKQVALLQDAIEHMHQGLCMYDGEGRVAVCNRRYAEILRLPPESIRPGVTTAEIVQLGIDAGHYPADKTIAQIRQDIRSQFSDSAGRPTMVRGDRTYAVQNLGTADGYFVATCEDITGQVEAENALRDSESQLRAILEAMPDCVKIFEESGRIIHINPKGLELLQAPDLESLSRPGYVPVPPEYLELCVDVHRRVVGGESVMWTYEVVGMEGRRRHVEAHSVPFRMPDGSKAHLCITRDVNERKESDDALRRSEERLRLVHEATGLADFESGTDGLLVCSDRFFEQLGLPVGDSGADAKAWAEQIHPQDRDRVIEEIEASIARKQESFNAEFRIVRADNGETRWIACSTRMQYGDDGALLRTIGAHLDITERKRADVALRQGEERMRLAHEATGLADFETDPYGRSICSDRFFAQCGLPVSPDQTVVFDEWIDVVHPEDRERLRAEVIKALTDQDAFGCQFRIIRADNGETRWISSRTRVERDGDGNVVRTIGAHLDITEQKRVEEALRASEARLRLVHEATGLGDFEAGPGGVTTFSDRFIEQIGLPPGTTSLTYDEWLRIVHPDDRARLASDIGAALASDEAFSCEFRIVRPDTGEIRWISSRTKMERDEAGRAIRSIGAHLDITERRAAEEDLRESEERFRLAAEAAGLGVWDYDAAADRREWSGRLREIFGISEDEEPSLELARSCIHPIDRARFMRRLKSVGEGKLERFADTFRIQRRRDEADRWVAVNGWRTRKAGSGQYRIIMTLRDVTDEKTAEERVRWSASHDALTRLANRGLFQEKLDNAIREAASDGGAVGLVLLDMDHFKQVNDTLGHDAGDKLLKMFADRLRGVVRSEDTVARFGGDEFAIVMPGLDSEQSLVELTDSIQDRMREPFVHGGRILDCRASMGASMFPVHGRKVEELLKNADIALYAAKAAGRATVNMFEPHMRDDVQQRISMVQLARNAIRDDRVVPYYQPKLALADGAVVGFEALLRWRTPTGRIGSPGALEAAFEDLEVASALSDRMIERVIADIRGWLDKGVPFQHIAVNASAAEFRRDSFAERVLEQLRRAKVPTRCFQLEVTETVFLGRGAEYVHRALALLSSHGVKIALDDFGTGYASLRHLKQFPVDSMKIDRTFVRDMEADPGDEAIIRAVINLGHSLGIKVVAEGIETDSQARRLIELGCEFGQGFLFSKAVAERNVPALVGHRPRNASGEIKKTPDGKLRLVSSGR